MAEGRAIRWGIVGAGNIAHRFAASLAHEPGSELTAVSGRSRARVEAFAASYGVGAAGIFLSHDELLADSAVDAIYLALPHGLHARWAERALRAGKAVLCEKPAALSADEVRGVAAAARETGVLFMEAMKARFVPLACRVRELAGSGELGAVTGVEARYHTPLDPAPDGYLLDPAQGGVLLDLGVYVASWLEELLPGAIELEDVRVRWRDGVDWADDARLRIGGRSARLEVAADRGQLSVCAVEFEGGRIELDPLHRPVHATVRRTDAVPEEIDAPYEVDDFYSEIAHFAQCLRKGRTESPIMPLAASIRTAEILDTVRAGWPKASQRG